MTDQPTKVEYEIDLIGTPFAQTDAKTRIRNLTPGDRDQLAHLILDSYLGTIDYEGETIVEAREAIDDWLEKSPLLDHSFAVLIDDAIISAVLAMTLDDEPFISIVMTHPEQNGKGYGTAAVKATLQSLQSTGHTKVTLFITQGNSPSEKLFTSLGATPVPRSGI